MAKNIIKISALVLIGILLFAGGWFGNKYLANRNYETARDVGDTFTANITENPTEAYEALSPVQQEQITQTEFENSIKEFTDLGLEASNYTLYEGGNSYLYAQDYANAEINVEKTVSLLITNADGEFLVESYTIQ